MNLKRKKLQDDLNERLLMRPGPLELVTKNILDPNSFVGHAVKEGNLEYTDTKNSTLIVNALSPPESFNDDSPQPSPDSTSIGSPSEPSPSPVFVSPPKMMFQGSQPSFPVTGHMKLKHDTKSRKKSSKAKFKKYKYHEYRPPNTETSSSKSDTTLPADSPYALLLQQQQLYLQLQVLCQNYPQTFLPLLPAVQKNSQSESQPAEKPMKLEEMRVIDLRNELKSRGLPVSGSKNNLMERLKLANAAQQESGNLTTVTSAVSMVTQTTPVAVAPRTTLTRSTSAPGGVAMVNSIKPAKIINDAEKILQMEQNISVEEIQQKIQQLQYLNVQLQLQQLDLKKSQQGKALQPKPLSADTASQIPVVPNQQPLHHPSISLASPLPQQLQPQQNQQQQTQLGAQNQQQQQTIQVQQQQLEQHLQQLKQLQQQQQVEQQKEPKQLHQQQLKHQQFRQQQKLLQQQQQQQANQQLNQQLLYNQLPTSQTPSISLQTKSESSDVTISSAVTSLPPPQQCQVSISATPLLHCSTLTCNKNCSHVQEASADTTTTPNVNSVQQHNVIHFKQPVKPVIILQPAKPQQRAELLFSPPGQQLAGDMTDETFFQHLNKSDGVSSLHGDMSMEHDTNWQAMIENDVHSSSSSPTAVERSPPPYFEAVAGKRSSSFSANNTAGIPKTPQRTNSVGSTSPLANRRSLSVPSVSHSSVQQQDLQKGHKSVSTMCLDFPEADEMSDMADNYHGITQELQKVNWMLSMYGGALVFLFC